MERSRIFFVIALIVLVGCGKEKIQQNKAGYFVLNQVQSPGLKSASVVSTDTEQTFSLGNIKASKEFYFLLFNGGESPIFDISLNTGNSSFIMSPEQISLLPGSNSSAVGQVIPLISLGVLHGIQLNGVGYADLLPKNENYGVIQIEGKTIENGDTISISSEFTFSVNAKVMDIRLKEGANEIDLTSPTGRVFYAGGDSPSYRTQSSSIEVQNTGNVSINLSVTGLQSGSEGTAEEFVLGEGQAETIDLTYKNTILSLGSNGTIADHSKIQLADDGKGYLMIENLTDTTLTW
jgi:hypothetical protein